MLKKSLVKIKELFFVNDDKVNAYRCELEDIEIMLWEAELNKKEYGNYTESDFKGLVESTVGEYLYELQGDLQGDATYYDIDYNGTTLDHDSVSQALESNEGKYRKMAEIKVKSIKQSISNISKLEAERERLIQSCRSRTGMSQRRFNRLVA